MIQMCEFPAAPRLPRRGMDDHVPEKHLVPATCGDVQKHVIARLLRQARNVQLEVMNLRDRVLHEARELGYLGVQLRDGGVRHFERGRL